jgi:hypothetical protein
VHTAIRDILQRLDPKDVEQVFCRYAAGLLDVAGGPSQRAIALDGKVLKGSFDNFRDRKAAQLLHALDTKFGLVLTHIDIDEKSDKIPAAQQLASDLHIAHSTITLDAMHCQKNLRGCSASPGASDHPTEGQSAYLNAKCRNCLRLSLSNQQ